MIHARKDYDRIQDPDDKIPLDEPVFLLRGQDPVAADAVRYWLALHLEEPVSQVRNWRDAADPLVRAVLIHVEKMEHWARHAKHGPADVDEDQLRLF